MGATASVQLTCNDAFSPILCQHWGGKKFHEEVKKWITEHYKTESKDITDRWEMCRIFVRLVQKFGDNGYVERERYLVDDSDYGCLKIDVTGEPKFTLVQ